MGVGDMGDAFYISGAVDGADEGENAQKGLPHALSSDHDTILVAAAAVAVECELEGSVVADGGMDRAIRALEYAAGPGKCHHVRRDRITTAGAAVVEGPPGLVQLGVDVAAAVGVVVVAG